MGRWSLATVVIFLSCLQAITTNAQVREQSQRVEVITTDSVRSHSVRSAFSVVRIRIVAVSDDPDSTLAIAGTHRLPLRCVDAVILDSTKGSCDSGLPNLRFYYSPIWSKSGSDLIPAFVNSKDSLILLRDAMGLTAVEVNQEYVALLDMTGDRYSPNPYHHARPIMDGAGGLHLIRNGVVLNPKRLLGMGDSVEANSFESGLREALNRQR